MSGHGSNKAERWDDLSKDTAHSELLKESRRFRDYQLSFTKWTISLVLAIGGAYLGLLEKTPFVPGAPTRIVLTVVVGALWIGTWRVIWHADTRHQAIIDFLKTVKPTFMASFEQEHRLLKPHHVLNILVSLVCAAVVFVIMAYPRPMFGV